MIATLGAKLLRSNAPQARLYTEEISSHPILVGHVAGLDERKGPMSDPHARTNIELQLERFTKKFRKKHSIPINAFLIWGRLGTASLSFYKGWMDGIALWIMHFLVVSFT
ncbi:hypothetical protein ACJ73_00012 [Blastomyces percursus]|uniref:Uncharacterized protein n=1 Tax=Blastomyces percursus TaxID=1658174 RepID=A0A1J9R860_9EURO|nr:hypothetical protein ACJ73_00012 [Blastomyces percursus]